MVHLMGKLGLIYKEVLWKQVLKGSGLPANLKDLAKDLVTHSEFSLREI